MKNTYFKTLPLLGAVVCLAAQSSFGVINFQSTGTSAGGAAVDSTASVSISGSLLTVTLTDNLVNPNGVANLLNGFNIVITGATGANTLTAQNANTRTVAADGSYTSGSVSGATLASSWALSASGSSITLSALGGGQPEYLIIGPAAANNLYAAAGGSIAGNGPHNPFVYQTATFSFNITGSGITEDKITGFTFLYGTSSDYGGTTRTNITSIPEPSTVVAGALLLVPLGVQALRSYRSRKQ